MSHTHAAVKYKPLGKAQVGAGGAGNFLFLAEKELEGGQREKPNTQATPGKRFPGRRRGSCDLKVLSVLQAPSFALGICQCYALLCLGFWVRISRLRRNTAVPLHHPNEHDRFGECCCPEGYCSHPSPVILEPSGKGYVSMGFAAWSVGANTRNSPSLPYSPWPLLTQLDEGYSGQPRVAA